MAAGGALFSLALAALLAANGLLRDAWKSYGEMQLAYIGQPVPGAVWALLERVPDFRALFVPAGIVGALAAGSLLLSPSGRKRAPRLHRLLGAELAGILLVAFYQVYQPHRPYGHYT